MVWQIVLPLRIETTAAKIVIFIGVDPTPKEMAIPTKNATFLQIVRIKYLNRIHEIEETFFF